jgi:hypothetical protein
VAGSFLHIPERDTGVEAPAGPAFTEPKDRAGRDAEAGDPAEVHDSGAAERGEHAASEHAALAARLARWIDT